MRAYARARRVAEEGSEGERAKVVCVCGRVCSKAKGAPDEAFDAAPCRRCVAREAQCRRRCPGPIGPNHSLMVRRDSDGDGDGDGDGDSHGDSATAACCASRAFPFPSA
eukprot:1472793-Pleurochrysis_carterae.AAC.2